MPANNETQPLLGQNRPSIPRSGALQNGKGNDEKLDTFGGVFLPTTLNVLSILMFLRFGFIVGQMGIVGGIALLLLSYLINSLTVLSVSAIATNGTVKGGGAYYMISRSLGPEFGGAIGVIFFVGQVLNSSLNVVGFIEPLLINFGANGDVAKLLPVSYLWETTYSTVLLCICTGVALVGATLVSRTAFWLFVVLTISTLSIPISALFVSPGYPLEAPYNHLKYSGITWSTIVGNLWPHFTSGAAGSTRRGGQTEDFKNLFGIFFPATAGIFAGASMSGDLKSPLRSIPKGTLAGLGVSFILYFLVIVSLGASVPREMLLVDIKILQTVSINGIIIALGEFSTSLFSIIMGIVGAASMLNAIADDRIIPGLSAFSTLKKLKAEKRAAEIKGVLFTWLIAQVFLFADINKLASVITMAFLMTFFVTNLACFLLRVGSAPNFRPSFKYFSTKTALSGGVASVVAMYVVDGISATSIIILVIFLIMVIHYSAPPLKFGDISQLLIYHQVRKYLLRLKLRMSTKYWRPQILLLCDNPRTSWNLIRFCNHLKKGGLYILGHVVLMRESSELNAQKLEFGIDAYNEIRKQKRAWVKLRDMLRIKAFVQIAIGPSLPWGVRNVYLGSGLGGMRPNITVLGFYDFHKRGITLSSMSPQKLKLPTDDCRMEEKVSPSQWVQILEDLVTMQATVAVAANFQHLNLPEIEKQPWFRKHAPGSSTRKYIDLYPIQMSSISFTDDGQSVMSTNFDTYTLIMQLGSILASVDAWKYTNHKLRIIAFLEKQEEEEEERKRLTELLASLRIDAELKIIGFDRGSLDSYNILVKGQTPKGPAYENIQKLLANDEWWRNLSSVRQSVKDFDRAHTNRKAQSKWRAIKNYKGLPAASDLSKTFTDIQGAPTNFSAKRRFTLSNLHERGLSLDMKAQSSGSYFRIEDPVASSDSEEESDWRPVYPQAPTMRAPSSKHTELSQTKPRNDLRRKTGYNLHYDSPMAGLSADTLSIKSSRSNLKPNFLAVKIPKAEFINDEEADEVCDDDFTDTKPSIHFVDDGASASAVLKAEQDELRLSDRHKLRGSRIFLSQDASEIDKARPRNYGEPGSYDDECKDLEDIKKELAELTFNDIPAKGQHIILNELMRQHSKVDVTDVIFSTLPVPSLGTHLNEAESMEYASSLALMFSDLPPTVLLNSQTVTVTTAL